MTLLDKGHDALVSEQRKTSTRVSVSPSAYQSALRKMATRGMMRLTANQQQALNGRALSRKAASGNQDVTRAAAGRRSTTV